MSSLKVIAANLTAQEIDILMLGAQPLKGNFSIRSQLKHKIATLIQMQHHIDPVLLPRLVDIQQFRDRRFAEKLTKSTAPAILIAGNHHIQKDLGVPVHLLDYGVKQNVVTLMLKTNEENITLLQADYLWIIE